MVPQPPSAPEDRQPQEDPRLVFERFSRRLIGLARAHLNGRLQHKVDPEDVVQRVSMIGVNIGVAAPMAFFPFGGTKGSFFGDLKAHGQDSIEFYTDKKVVISRW